MTDGYTQTAGGIYRPKTEKEWAKELGPTEYVYQNGLAVPLHIAKERVKPTCVDLFSGAGGMSLGVIDAGFEVICAVENEPWAAMTYLSNLGQWPMPLHCVTEKDKVRLEKAIEKSAKENAKAQKRKGATLVDYPTCGQHRPPDRTPVRSFIFGDITQVTGKMIRSVAGLQPDEEIDTVCGGPPCQGFSTSNTKRHAKDPRNEMIFEFARLVTELWPRTFVMENVPEMVNMVTAEGVPVLDAFCAAISKTGYAAHEGLRKALLQDTSRGAATRANTSKLHKEKKRPPVKVERGQGELFT